METDPILEGSWGEGRSDETSARRDKQSVLARDLKETPYWWEDAPPPDLATDAPPASVDVAVIGSGYTGLNAALVTARAERSTLVLDAEHAGWGCSTRNGGQVSTSIKPSLAELSRRHGAASAAAIRREGSSALEWLADFVVAERIECDFRRTGRFHAAHTPEQFDALVQKAEAEHREGIEAHPMQRREQHREIGTEAYHGGLIYPRHASLHPAKYHRGLTERVTAAGAHIVPHCPVLAVERAGTRFLLRTPASTIQARDVIVATNGYGGGLVPWLRNRIIPIGSYMIATEPLEPGTVERLFPTDRVVSDTRRVIYYFRASPDRRRVLFGGRVSTRETDPRISGPHLHAAMTRLFPELRNTQVSHSWVGTVAYSFDSLAHCGVHDGIHYSTSYCGSGVSMASYLGMRSGQRVLGLKEGRTAFDDLPFPTRPLYFGRPWFLPAVVAYYAWRDQRESKRAAGAPRVG